MSALSNYAKSNILNLMFGGTAWSTKPSTLYLALYTAAPSDSGGGTQVSAGGYARASVACTAEKFEVSGLTATNLDTIEFSAATANWGTVSHWGVFDASTGGNLIAWGALPQTLEITSGMIVRITAGQLTFTLSSATNGGIGNGAANDLLMFLFQSAPTLTVDQSTGVNTGTEVLTTSGTVPPNGSRVRVSSSGSLPTGLSSSTDYYVISRTTTTFQLSTTVGGSAVNITATGSGTMTVTVTPHVATQYFALGSVSSASGINVEQAGSGYARKSMTNNTTTWSTTVSGGSSKVNGTAVTFTSPTDPGGGVGDWTENTKWAIMDASSGGNCVWWGTLSAASTPGISDVVRFQANAITLTAD